MFQNVSEVNQKYHALKHEIRKHYSYLFVHIFQLECFESWQYPHASQLCANPLCIDYELMHIYILECWSVPPRQPLEGNYHMVYA